MALAGALGAFDVEHVELAFDVAEYEIGSGHRAGRHLPAIRSPRRRGRAELAGFRGRGPGPFAG
jgi:hypothetical protein